MTGAAWVAAQTGYRNFLTFDMGGTSTDVALVEDLTPRIGRETTVGDLKVRATSVDVRTVGAGGGSVDDVPAYEPPVDGTEDDSAQEPSSPSSPARPRITVTTAQPPVVSRPTTTKPTSDGASGRPQPQHKPRSQRKK